VRGWWKDTGTREDLLHAQELVIGDLERSVEGETEGCSIVGAVKVGRGSHLVDCLITGPAVIGEGVSMERATVDPLTSIGDRCRLSDADVGRSIIMEGAEVQGWVLRDSVLGRGTRLRGRAPSGPVQMTLGDHSEITGG
jgi:glucose-1-phosphate thymidylyltransferase